MFQRRKVDQNIAARDTGYTKICGQCCKRHGHNLSLVRKEREVRFETCVDCSKQEDARKDRPSAYIRNKTRSRG